MRKINYPFFESELKINPTKKKEFLDEYLKVFNPDFLKNIDTKIKTIKPDWDSKTLLTSNFNVLLDIINFAEENDNWNELIKLFCTIKKKDKEYTYSKEQRKIADFFIDQKLDLRSCHYCNIDFINPFNSFIEYEDEDKFIKHATKEEWVELLSEKKGKDIYSTIKDNQIKTLDSLKRFKIAGVGVQSLDKITLTNINFLKKYKDHFTLDHILPKSTYPFLSLSLFNLIPSCYSCNSKLKGSKEFIVNDFLKKLSPSSIEFDFDKKVKFELRFNLQDVKQIQNIDEFKVTLVNNQSNEEIDDFFDMFKLRGRYEFHKGIAYEMINKRKKYSDSQLNELSKLLNVSVDILKKDIFGKEAFEENNYPFEKYKGDIAEQLELK